MRGWDRLPPDDGVLDTEWPVCVCVVENLQSVWGEAH